MAQELGGYRSGGGGGGTRQWQWGDGLRHMPAPRLPPGARPGAGARKAPDVRTQLLFTHHAPAGPRISQHARWLSKTFPSSCEPLLSKDPPELVVLGLRKPHLLKRPQGRDDGAADPHAEASLDVAWRDHSHFVAGWDERRDLPL